MYDSDFEAFQTITKKYVDQLNKLKEEAIKEITEYHEKDCEAKNKGACTAAVSEMFLNHIYATAGTIIVKYQKVIRASELLN